MGTDEYTKRRWVNQEITSSTQSVYHARHLAFRGAAMRHGATTPLGWLARIAI